MFNLLIRLILVASHNLRSGKSLRLDTLVFYLVCKVKRHPALINLFVEVTLYLIFNLAKLVLFRLLLDLLLWNISFNDVSPLHYLIDQIEDANVKSRFLLDLLDGKVSWGNCLFLLHEQAKLVIYHRVDLRFDDS
jgi:hypothetical protein